MPDVASMPAERLMARFQSRLDLAAFECLAARFIRPATAAARRILSDRALAEDAVQEAFLRLIHKRDQYDPAKPFAPWFYAIVRHAALDLARRRARHEQLMDDLASGRTPVCRLEAEGPQGPHTEADPADDLLHLLPSGERDVLILRIAEDMPFRDVAAALGISEEAAKKRAQRGLQRLRRRMLAPGRVEAV